MKKIWLSDTACRQVYVSFGSDEEYWNCEQCKNDVQRVAEFLKKNGFDILEVADVEGEHYVKIDRNVHDFNGERYILNQCTGDIFEWFRNAIIGDFTYYFDKLVFNTEDGFVAAYIENINNNWGI